MIIYQINLQRTSKVVMLHHSGKAAHLAYLTPNFASTTNGN